MHTSHKPSGWLTSLLLSATLLVSCGDSPLSATPVPTSTATTGVSSAMATPVDTPAITTARLTTAGPTIPASTDTPAITTKPVITAPVATIAAEANPTVAPVEVNPPAPVVAGLGLVKYEIDADLPADQAEIIRKGIALGQKELGLVPEFTIQAGNSVELPVKADGTTEHDFSGVANGTGIQFYTSASAWKDDKARGQYATVIHEYFHMVQYYLAKTANEPDSGENAVDRDGPQWIGEGSANFMAARVLDRAGIYPYADYRKEELDSAVTLQVPLKQVETASQKTLNEPAAYDLGFMALDFMNTRYGNTEQNLKKYYALIGKNTKWEEAFQKAFNISIADFYREFEIYRSKGYSAPNP